MDEVEKVLSFAEEIFLLSLDDVTGKVEGFPKKMALENALAGAALCELSFLNKVDTDMDYVYVVDTTPTGHPVLDDVLAILARATDKHSIEWWLSSRLLNCDKIQKQVLDELLKKKILKVEEGKILWFFASRRYPVIDNHEIKEVETRLRELIMGDEIPDPREAVLVSLVQACDLFPEILSPREMKRCEARIDNIAKMDFVGQAVSRLVHQIEAFTLM